MQLQTFLILYVVSVPLFILGDLLWLGFFAKGFYRAQIGHLMGSTVWIAALVFYAIFLAGLTFFASYPATMRGTIATAVILGGMFGFFTYATCGLTNLATLRSWPTKVVVVDMLWGTVFSACVAAGAFAIRNLFI